MMIKSSGNWWEQREVSGNKSGNSILRPNYFKTCIITIKYVHISTNFPIPTCVFNKINKSTTTSYTHMHTWGGNRENWELSPQPFTTQNDKVGTVMGIMPFSFPPNHKK